MLRVPITDADHVIGSPRAPVTLVEYGDYQCPHCAMAHTMVQLVLKHFGKRLLFAFRHFPLTEIHPFAESAAETGEFAGVYNRFWEMHDGLFENQSSLGLPLLFVLAGALDLPEVELREALATRKFEPKVRADFIGGVRSGVNGTPTFFINGQRHDGAFALEDLVAAIELNLHAKAPS